LLIADCTTKNLAVERLSPAHVPHDVLGDWLRLTLTYNAGGVMGLSLGPYSRIGFAALAVAALAVLVHFRRTAPGTATGPTVGLALVMAGAAGNLLDRLRSARGVIDFIDVGIGSLRFWTFNIADACLTTGAVLLALALWRPLRPRGAA
jgi:signal peptidase II